MLNFVVVVLICVQLFATPWTAACQAPLSMEFSQTENTGVGCSFFCRDLPDPRMGTKSPASPALAGKFFYHCATWKSLLGIATR